MAQFTYTAGLKSTHFLLAEEYINLNHGSFGTVPKAIFNKQIEYFRLQESRPDEWFRHTYYKLIDESRLAIANLINAQCEDVVLVENASTAVNAIFRSNLKVGQSIEVLSL